MPFRKISETRVHDGPVISVRTGVFESPDGHRFERELVHHPGAVVVVPLVDEDTALLVRQYRSAIDTELLELPAGKRDVDGEDPADTAVRELAEEVGMRAGRIEKLAEFYNSPGFSDEHSILYLATDLDDCGRDAQGVEEGHMSVVTLRLGDVPAMVEKGEIVDAKTIIGLTLAANALG